MNKAQRHDRQPDLQGEHSHTVCCNVKGFHGSGVRACSYVTMDPTCFGVRCKQATLILNIPDLKWEQVNINRRIIHIIYLRKSNTTLKKYAIISLSPAFQIVGLLKGTLCWTCWLLFVKNTFKGAVTNSEKDIVEFYLRWYLTTWKRDSTIQYLSPEQS